MKSGGKRNKRTKGGGDAPERVRLLLVDDMPAAARVLRRVLGRYAPGWTLDCVTIAEECVRLGLSDEYDIVLIDENLNHPISGTDACRELRRYGCNATLLIYAADDSDEARQRAHEAGADGFLSKGLAPRELVARIAETLRYPPERMVRECAPLRLDLCAGRVTVDGVSVDLTKQEYNLLLALTARVGATVSRERLCQAGEIEPSENFRNLHSEMHRLRAKLGDRTGVLIRTDRGKGYRLCRPPWTGFCQK